MKIDNYRLENTFLTAANTVAMQWTTKAGAQFTIWLDKRGTLCNSSTSPVPANVYMKALDYYEKNEGRLINESYQDGVVHS